MRLSRLGPLVLIVSVLLTACTPPAPTVGSPTREPQAGGTSAATGGPAIAPTAGGQPTAILATGPSRNLTFGVRYELTGLLDKQAVNTTADSTWRLFNASLTYIDSKGQVQPYLAESLPMLDTESWKLLPDGQMDTTYKLKPNLLWHDGNPLQAQDFTFGFLVYSTPALTGRFDPTGHAGILGVSSPDPRTVIIRWDALYPDAGSLRARLFDPLPKHILERAWMQAFASYTLNTEAADTFMSHPYWTSQFVHAGPYRLAEWVPGSHLEAVAFDAHVLGRPKIDRITVRIIPDENTMLSNLLAGEVHIAADNALRYEQAQVLRREWGPTNKGVVLLDPVQPRITNIQFRPDLVNPRALLDVRVRRALAYAVDRQALVQGLFNGEVPPSDQLLPRSTPYFADLDRSVRKYPYDLRQTEQLMADAGYRKGSDGIYANSAGERFSLENWVLAGTQNEKQGAIMSNGFRQAGFDVKESVIPAAKALDGQARATFPALSNVATTYGELSLSSLASDQIPTAVNRWRGANRGGWANPQYDGLWDQFNDTLDRAARNRQAVQMMQVATEELPVLFLFHSPVVTAHVAGLHGPELGPPEHLIFWNIHEWTFQ